MNNQGHNSYAQARRRGNQRFTDTARNGKRFAGLHTEDIERRNHAGDGTQQAEERRKGNDHP